MRPNVQLALGLAAGALALAVAQAGAGAASAPPAAPTCTPRALNASSQLDGAVTVSPMPGAADASPQTQISFLGVPVAQLGAVSVVGSRSGTHAGVLDAYSQGDGGSFVPRTPFIPGERVTVTAQLSVAGALQPLDYTFTVAETDPITAMPEPPHPDAPHSRQALPSRPDLQPPTLSVHVDSQLHAPGDVFLAPYGVAAQAGPMIVDPAGKLIWFAPLRAPMVAANLRVQTYAGASVLTWWQGTLTTHGFGRGVDEIAGQGYQHIAVVRAGNGRQADLHEFQITPAGTALITAYAPIRCNLAPIGGTAAGAVTDALLQEIDIKTGLVRFEWTAVDHVALRDSYSTIAGSSAARPYDFFHLNSINLDADASLLVSSRNTWSVDDIDPVSGAIRWTLGGKRSSFTEGRGAPTAFQHDARPLGPDTFSVFDNGASPQAHRESRGVVLAINPQTNTVSVAAQFLHPGHRLLSDSQGNMQALPGGDFLIGWGQEPDVSEFAPSGQLVFDASLPRGYESYRALRFPWSARPSTLPALRVLRGASGGAPIAYMSWNGATAVARWQLLEGRSAHRLAIVGSVARSNFETAIRLRGGPAEEFVAVRALDAQGTALASSPTVAVPAARRGAGAP